MSGEKNVMDDKTCAIIDLHTMSKKLLKTRKKLNKLSFFS